MLEFDALVRDFGAIRALDHLSFPVPPGVLFGFLGPNGAGKTTAMRAVFGLTALGEGEVRWAGEPVTRAHAGRFGYLPEERGLYPSMTVADQLTYLGRIHGLSRSAASTATASWLERLGLGDRGGDRVEQLSLGNQQRVQLAGALLHEPDLLVLDEPFSGLDPVAVDTLSGVLAEVAARGATVLFSSHQLDLVEGICEQVAIIDHGRLVASGSVEELTRGATPRLVVDVEATGDRSPTRWAEGLAGVRIEAIEASTTRLELADGTDDQLVLDAARAAGRVVRFGYERQRLSEVFRTAVGR